MHTLTHQLLDKFPYSLYADARTIQLGRAYYKDERVWDVSLSTNDSKATCLVDGDSGEYTVEIEVDQKSGQLYFECDCPYAKEHFCKHMVAAALDVSAYLKEETDDFEEEDEEFLPSPRATSARTAATKPRNSIHSAEKVKCTRIPPFMKPRPDLI